MRDLNVPELGEAIPKRGNAFSRGMGGAVLRSLGWRFGGVPVPNVGRAVLIVAPHTSNWDFFIGVAAMFALGIRVVFLGKHSLFFWPLGPVMRWLGGIAVDRRTASGVVDDTVELFASRERMLLGLSPEGTRSTVDRWKSGFYFIADRANVPIIPASLDYKRREIRIGDAFETTGDLENDLPHLVGFFQGIAGKNTE
jgi:1-acyl-sn-glycerol-3-phosphate acyltransferase